MVAAMGGMGIIKRPSLRRGPSQFVFTTPS